MMISNNNNGLSTDNSQVMYANIANSYQKKVDAPPIGITYMLTQQHYSEVNSIWQQEVFKPKMYHHIPKQNYKTRSINDLI